MNKKVVNLNALPTLSPEAQDAVITAVIRDRIQRTIEQVFEEGVTVNDVKYGVATPSVIRACQEIAHDEHEDMHQTIAEMVSDGEDDDLVCPICGEEVCADCGGVHHDEEQGQKQLALAAGAVN